MAATYKQFLVAPNSALLADTASLHYVTTITTFAGPTQIIKHLNGLQKQITKQKEDILNVVDGQNAIVVEVDTGLAFQTGGGPYLPGVDDNFLTSRVAYFPITHFVSFDEEGKIAQIRLQWDQGSLLKQVEIIGKSGRNWPITDSREQITYIQACLKSSGTMAAAPLSHNETLNRNRGNSNNAFRDPHASLQLFGPREEIEAPHPAAVVSPYGGNRPQQRSFTDILGDEPPEAGSPSAHRHRSMSPSKAGQGKNFKPSRIFDGQQNFDEAEPPKSNLNKFIRPNPTKFSHFDFADGSDPQDAPLPGQSFDERPKSKHDSQWSFGDFTTPQKQKPSKTVRSQDVRHWDTDKDTIEATPHQAPRPRRDADTHFELQDDGETVPQPTRPGAKPRGYTHNEGLGLYKNQLFDKEDPDSGPNRALGNITNLKDRGKTFDHQFNMTDDSPAHNQRAQNVPEGRKKAAQMMEANWSSYEQSPVPKKENRSAEGPSDNGIHIAGDGMGGRKGTNRDWLYNETTEAAQAIPSRKAPAGPAASAVHNKSGIHISGDGMGGKRGADRHYLEIEDDEDEPSKAVPSRRQGSSAPGIQNQSARIHIAGDGMGGKRGADRHYLELEDDEDQVSKAVPSRKQGASTAAFENKSDQIHISGDGMGGKRGTDRHFLELDDDEDEISKAVPSRKQGASAAAPTENKTDRIHIAGDGMGGKKGTNRDWLYGDLNDNGNENTQPAPTRKQNANTTAGRNGFWDF
ncbi:hypothetical protein QQZ08_012278 [Neonectria magnoliae]|uniref:Uncharacterized protein n=1 Tax=Neonectria magnoliae TaxID=2732573 RepID=A0ABR1H438_9HYPO